MKKNYTVVKVGSVEDFFARAKKVADKLDNKKIIRPSHIVTFEDPVDMMRFLSPKKMEVINVIKINPLKTITELSHILHRNRSTISKEIDNMAKAGILKVHVVNNPGHGKTKRISLSCKKLVLQKTTINL